jgi:plastocyanin
MKFRSALLGLLLPALLLSSCKISSSSTTGNVSSSSLGDELGAGVISSSSVATVSVASVPAVRIVQLNVTSTSFDPATITASQNEVVKLQVLAQDGDHSLSIPDLGIMLPLPQDNSLTINLPTGTTGSFDYYCTINCGSDRSVKGRITIH